MARLTLSIRSGEDSSRARGRMSISFVHRNHDPLSVISHHSMNYTQPRFDLTFNFRSLQPRMQMALSLANE